MRIKNKWVFVVSLFVCVIYFFPAISNAGQGTMASLKVLKYFNFNNPKKKSLGNSFSSCMPYHATIPGLYGGYFNMDGDICDSTAKFVYDYHDFSSYPDIITNGQIQANFTVDDLYNPSTLSVIFSGGPVHYLVYNDNYEVYFNDFTIVFDIWIGGAEISEVRGGLTANGVYIPANNILADILF